MLNNIAGDMNPMFYSGTNQNVDFELWLLLSFYLMNQIAPCQMVYFFQPVHPL